MLSVILLNVIMLNVANNSIMLSVILLSVVMLVVVAPNIQLTIPFKHDMYLIYAEPTFIFVICSYNPSA